MSLHTPSAIARIFRNRYSLPLLAVLAAIPSLAAVFNVSADDWADRQVVEQENVQEEPLALSSGDTCTGSLRIESITVSPAEVEPGEAVELSATICSDSNFSGHLTMFFDDGAFGKIPMQENGQVLSDKIFGNQSFSDGQLKSFSWRFVVPESQFEGALRPNIAIYSIGNWVDKLVERYGANDSLTVMPDYTLGTPRTYWPRDLKVEVNPNYEWGAVSGASEYTIEGRIKRDDPWSKWWVTLPASVIGCQQATDVCKFIYAPESSGYNQWRVRAEHAESGSVGRWSSWRDFYSTSSMDETAPELPSTLWPRGYLVERNPKYKWSAVPGATEYKIVTRRVGTNEVVVYKTINAARARCQRGTGECTFTKIDSWLSGTYEWRVMSSSIYGNSRWSDSREFVVGN